MPPIERVQRPFGPRTKVRDAERTRSASRRRQKPPAIWRRYRLPNDGTSAGEWSGCATVRGVPRAVHRRCGSEDEHLPMCSRRSPREAAAGPGRDDVGTEGWMFPEALKRSSAAPVPARMTWVDPSCAREASKPVATCRPMPPMQTNVSHQKRARDASSFGMVQERARHEEQKQDDRGLE